VRALWRVSLILAPNLSLLSRGYILMNVLKALASIIYVRSLRVIFFTKSAPRYFILFTNGMLRSFNARTESGGIIQLGK
jgi:hypothetical protein